MFRALAIRRRFRLDYGDDVSSVRPSSSLRFDYVRANRETVGCACLYRRWRSYAIGGKVTSPATRQRERHSFLRNQPFIPKNKPYLKMRPSLAMEYNILGKGRSAPSRDDLSPQRPPIMITYLGHGAPFKTNALGNVPSSGRAL